ncbi:MAG: hypothetical protein IIB44_13855 [Candidatus Marinimicrobia bacterium]|nr:hypothetical protein [Candidatus Neomarinimicrobiota bacterium]
MWMTYRSRDQKQALNLLCVNHKVRLILLGEKMMALPFYEEGEPDIGATIDLLWCTTKN